MWWLLIWPVFAARSEANAIHQMNRRLQIGSAVFGGEGKRTLNSRRTTRNPVGHGSEKLRIWRVSERLGENGSTNRVILECRSQLWSKAAK